MRIKLKTRNVLAVPMVGINQSTGRKVPRIDPMVEIAYILPDMLPACSGDRMASRMANGDTQPSSVTGMLKRINTTKNEPSITAVDKCSTAFAA